MRKCGKRFHLRFDSLRTASLFSFLVAFYSFVSVAPTYTLNCS